MQFQFAGAHGETGFQFTGDMDGVTSGHASRYCPRARGHAAAIVATATCALSTPTADTRRTAIGTDTPHAPDAWRGGWRRLVHPSHPSKNENKLVAEDFRENPNSSKCPPMRVSR